MKKAAKFLTALAGAGAQMITLGLVSGTTRDWVSIAVGLLTAAAVFFVPNAPPTGPTST